MNQLAACSITVDTSVCSFIDAAAHAVDLAKTFVNVAFTHGNLTIQVRAGWTATELRTAWNYGQMVKQGKGIP